MSRATLLALLLSVAVDAPGQDGGPFAGIPNVTLDYYDVSGTSADAVRTAINAARPMDPDDGKTYDALTHWDIQWEWRTVDDVCQPSSAEVTVSTRVRLPRLANLESVSQSLRDRWTKYVSALQKHEVGHLIPVLDAIPGLQAAMRASPTCEAMEQLVKQAIADLTRQGIDYDRTTHHGATQGAVFP